MSHEHITLYLGRLVEETYGKDDLFLIMDTIKALENGDCGCELAVHTFPSLLRARGITPSRSYEREHGYPKEDGEQAATPEQRAKIRAALVEAGFSL